MYPFASPPTVPPYDRLVSQKTINALGLECLESDIACGDLGLASAAYTANLLIFIPLIVTHATLVSQFYWINGATVDGASSTDIGIYTEDGATKLGSTTPTTNSGTSQIQVVNVTDFYIPANRRMWLAFGCDSSTQTYWRGNPVVGFMDVIGMKQQAAGWSSGLPASVTLGTPTVAYFPYCGFTGGTI